MRILVLSNYYPPIELGGWEQLTCNVVNRLKARGHQVQVLTSNYRAGEAGQVEDVHRLLNLESYDPVRYHAQYTLVHRLQENENKRYLGDLVRRFNPEIIFINGMWNLPYSVARQAEELLPGCVVYYLASYWPTEPDAHTAYWTSKADGALKAMPKSILGSILRKTLIAGEPRNRLNFRLVLCVSAFVQAYAVREAGVPREHTRVVHNGIELEWFSVDRLAADVDDQRDLRLLYAGRLSPDKGVHTILEALEWLHKRREDLQIHLSIFGRGAPEYEAHLRQQAQDGSIEKWVSFQGLVRREQMPSVFAAHDVLIFPSVWPEPLARILQEAMACQLVVIGTATGGTEEILQDGVNGLTFEAGNAAMLAERILSVAEDPELRHRLAARARQTVEERFSLDRMVDEIEDSFRQILATNEPVFD